MKRIDSVLKKLSDLYEFNRKIKTYRLRKGRKVAKAEGASLGGETGKARDRQVFPSKKKDHGLKP
jgi:hypothetical protein